MRIKQIIEYLISIPKTVYINLAVFPLHDALKMPLIVSYHCKIGEIHRGSIIIENMEISTGIFKFGFGGTDGIQPISSKSYLQVSRFGKIILKGKVSFAQGSTIRVGGVLSIGAGCTFNKYTFISCNNKIMIGDDCLSGWNVNFRDTDNHQMYSQGEYVCCKHELIIGKHVWICAYVDLIKGNVGDNSIVGYKSLVNKNFSEDSNVLLAGIPANIMKRNIIWKR